jgi:hypothetical protein
MKLTEKQQWIADLRSGEYKQGFGALKTDDGFCCLGVLADRIYAQHGTWRWIKNGAHWHLEPVTNHGEDDTVSFLPADSPLLYDVQELLSRNNDSGTSFTEIADWIEECVLGE